MKSRQRILDRRNFMKRTSIFTLGSSGLMIHPLTSHESPLTGEEEINIIGPKEGYTPQIGTMVSMLNWMRRVILYPVGGLTVEELDYLHDPKANSIGALLFHLAAIERFYQIHTFEGRRWGDWPEGIGEEWLIAGRLGDEARETIKGNDIRFYLQKLKNVRKKTLEGFARRDDEWLMRVDKNWSWGPTNNYCKWFHVCEHESNHNGQVKWLKSRLPSNR